MLFELFWSYLEGDAVGSTKGCACVRVRALLQNLVHDTSHPETRTSRIESVLCDIVGERNSEHGFFEIR